MSMGLNLAAIKDQIAEFEMATREWHNLQHAVRLSHLTRNRTETSLIAATIQNLLTGSSDNLESYEDTFKHIQATYLKELNHLKAFERKLFSLKAELDKLSKDKVVGAALEELSEYTDMVNAASLPDKASPTDEATLEEASALLSAVHFGQEHMIACATSISAKYIIDKALAKEAGCKTYGDVLSMVYPLDSEVTEEHGVGGKRHALQPKIAEILNAKLDKIKSADMDLSFPLNIQANCYLIEQLELSFKFMAMAKALKLNIKDTEKPRDTMIEIYPEAATELAKKFLGNIFSTFFLTRRAESFANFIITEVSELSRIEEQFSGQLLRYYQAIADYLQNADHYDEDEKAGKNLNISMIKLEITRLNTERLNHFLEYSRLNEIMEKSKIPALQNKLALLDGMGFRRSHPPAKCVEAALTATITPCKDALSAAGTAAPSPEKARWSQKLTPS